MQCLSREKVRLVVGVLILLLTATACAAREADDLVTIYYGLGTEPAGIDPHRHEAPQVGIIARQLYDTLVYRNPVSGEFVPGLAASWAISDDDLTYTFTLRQGVVFHDGTPFDAAAVGRNLDRIFSPEVGVSRARQLLGPLVSYQVSDPFTIQLILSEPYAPLLDGLSQPYLGIASPAAIDAVSLNRYQFYQVGTGPFRLVKYIPGGDIIQRNADYAWGPEFYAVSGDVRVDRFVFRFFPDVSSRAEMLSNGTVQIINDIAPEDARTLTGNSQVRLFPVNIPGQPIQYFFNVQQFPTDNRLVRQALLFGTNRQLLADSVMQGFPDIAWGPLAADTQFFNQELVDQFPFNIQQSRALLTSIGFADEDEDGFLDAAGQPLSVTFVTPSTGVISEVTQLIQQQWLDIGVLVNIEQVAGSAALQERIANGGYNLVATFNFGLDPVVLNQTFISTQGNNLSQYSNIQLDEALRTAARADTSALRRDLYNRIQQFIMEETLTLPIYDQVQLNAASVNVLGLQFDVFGWYPLLHNVALVVQ